MKTAKERLVSVCELKEVDVRTLEKIIKCPKDRLYNIYVERTMRISKSNADMICAVYPDISRDYLMFGKGDILSTGETSEKVSSEECEPSDFYAELVKELKNQIKQNNEIHRQTIDILKEQLQEANRTIRTLSQRIASPSSQPTHQQQMISMLENQTPHGVAEYHHPDVL